MIIGSLDDSFLVFPLDHPMFGLSHFPLIIGSWNDKKKDSPQPMDDRNENDTYNNKDSPQSTDDGNKNDINRLAKLRGLPQVLTCYWHWK